MIVFTTSFTHVWDQLLVFQLSVDYTLYTAHLIHLPPHGIFVSVTTRMRIVPIQYDFTIRTPLRVLLTHYVTTWCGCTDLTGDSRNYRS